MLNNYNLNYSLQLKKVYIFYLMKKNSSFLKIQKKVAFNDYDNYTYIYLISSECIKKKQ